MHTLKVCQEPTCGSTADRMCRRGTPPRRSLLGDRMTLKERIVADLTAAMKAKETDRLAVLRMLKAKMMEAEVAQREKKGLGYALEDPEAQAVIAAYAQQRRASSEAYRQGG